MRRLPNMLIIGAPRSGTTFLYNYLAAHPNVFMSARKEPWYFGMARHPHWSGPGDAQPTTDFDQYCALFDAADLSIHHIIGEGSTIYLSNPDAPAHVRATLPHPKLICLLRDPVDRAWSNYLQHVHDGREHLSFEKALNAQSARTSQRWSPYWGYETVSHYATHLRRWLSYFSRDEILLLLFRELTDFPRATCSRVEGFLGLPHGLAPLPERSQRNPSTVLVNGTIERKWHTFRTGKLGGLVKAAIPSTIRQRIVGSMLRSGHRGVRVPPAVRRRLLPVFEEDVSYVESLLNVELRHWRT